MKLNPHEITFNPLSVGTDYGRLFGWKGNTYRAISKERVEFYAQLLADGTLHDLARRNLLIETEATDLVLDGYPIILKHRTVPFISYCYEWCGDMFKAAALLVLELEKELLNRGLALIDRHPWNLLFIGTQPVWVDLGSIAPASFGQPERAYEEFSSYYTRPLQIMAAGHKRVARCLLRGEYPGGVSQRELEPFIEFAESDAQKMVRITKMGVKAIARSMLPEKLHPLAGRAARQLIRSPSNELQELSRHPLKIVDKSYREIHDIKFAQYGTKWSGHDIQKGFPDFDSTDDWTEKHHSICKILSITKPSTVLDIGCNRGWFSQLAARRGAQVVGFDLDELSVTKLLSDATKDSLSVLPLVGDFRSLNPIMAGPGIAPSERLQCDMVFALALVHNLLFWLDWPFDAIVRELAGFSRKWLAVEFVSAEDIYMKGEIESHWYYPSYTLETFLTCVRTHFSKIELFPSDSEHRSIVLCQR